MTSYSTAVARNARRARPSANDSEVGSSNGSSARLAASSSTKSSSLSHARQHSANSAGDVFGAFGSLQSNHNLSGSNGPAGNGRAATTGASSKTVSSVGEAQHPKLDAGSADAASRHAELDSSTSSSSTPSTPASSLGPQLKHPANGASSHLSRQKYQAFYTKPRLLSMWRGDLTADVPMKDMYALCESPDVHKSNLSGQDTSGPLTQQRQRYSAHDNEYGDRTLTKRTLDGTLGSAAPSSGPYRRTGTGERFTGLQGGVLSSVATVSRRDANDAFDTATASTAAVSNSRNSRGVLGGKSTERPLVPASAAWTSNRWRHLLDEDSASVSGSSSKEDTVLEEQPEQFWPIAKQTARDIDDTSGVSGTLGGLHIADTDRNPLLLTSVRSEKQYSDLPNGASEASYNAQSSLSWRRSLAEAPTSASLAVNDQDHASTMRDNQSAAGFGRVPDDERVKLAVKTQPVPLRSLTMRSPEKNLAGGPTSSPLNVAPQASTPSRRETVEGLEILARRSPVQEKSMAALQSQLPLSSSYVAQSQDLAPETRMWQYRDPYGALQGPFPAAQMQEWHQQRFFQETLLVKRVEWLEFETLGNLIMRIGDVHTPFLTARTSSFLPPGIVPGVSQAALPSPYVQQGASPWSAAAVRPVSRTQTVAQLLNNAAAGGFPTTDLHSAQHSAASDFAPTDPWADTLPSRVSSPSISRVNSTHGVGAIGRSFGSSSRLAEAPLPSPIGRSSSSKALDRIAQLQDAQKESDPANSASFAAVALSSEPIHTDSHKPRETEPLPAEPSAPVPVPERVSQVALKSDLATTRMTRSDEVTAKPKLPSKAEAAADTESAIQPNSKTAVAVPAVRKRRGSATLPHKTERTGTTPSKQKEDPKTSSDLPQHPSQAIVSDSHAEAETSRAAPWAKSASDTQVDAKSTSTGNMSLRDIQAKEEKETAVRKLAEKRAMQARIVNEEAAAAEKLARQAADRLPTASTWAETSSIAPSPTVSKWGKPIPAAPAANTHKGLSLKEIQEEEARKAKAASLQAIGAASEPGKAYAASAARVVSPSPQAAGPWTTVGVPKANSAASAAVVAVPAKPTTTAKPAALSRSGSAVQAGATVAKTSSDALPASADLLRWCKDALKGLDVSVDEFVIMLLSFPVPIDKGTKELIADSVYSSSRTLDGRHFAEAFADKRTSDLRAIKAGKVTIAPAVVPQKSKSMADAIKFVPAQQPLSDFKIVRPKGKGKK